jgi:nucleoside-diphosphate-sugar epimerase
MYNLLLNTEHAPEVLHFCRGKSVSLAELIAVMQRLTGHDMKIKVNHNFVRQNDVTFQCGSTGRLRKLGFEWKYSLEQTMEWMLQA